MNPSPTPDEIEAFAAVFDGLPTVAEGSGLMWSVSLNRRASASVWRSRLTVKADAAGRLFDARTTGIRWAVLDTGIDATHPAFARRGQQGKSKPQAGDGDTIESRVLKTYDFLRIKTLLDPDAEIAADGSAAATLPAETLREQREQLRNSLRRGRAIDWDLLEPFLRVPHTREHYRPPQHDGHGTHVAGILAANWPEAADSTPLGEPLMGVCPDIELYDLRVLPDDPNDRADEFTVIAALQFIRHLNAHKDLMVVHGVNLSLSVPHDVANYACGRTPVCEECERAVASGVVVVAAAGNRGFNKSVEAEGGALGDYRYISITDPGNADGVITVGSTHRMMPHNYGVSYFSSRGPTGDGRTKPDLVAPGERIESCALNGYVETMDGTSMAAPHVSGAAALLMSRHRELIGQPRRIKDILCRTATDLGREPRFQGAGIVDVLTRAFSRYDACDSPLTPSQANDGDCLLLHYARAGAPTASHPRRRRLARHLPAGAAAADRSVCATAASSICAWPSSATSTWITSPASSTCSATWSACRMTAATRSAGCARSGTTRSRKCTRAGGRPCSRRPSARRSAERRRRA